MRNIVIPQPRRVRVIDGTFAWIDHRLIREGFLKRMTQEDHSMYLFLALVADRYGISFYRKERICDILGLDWSDFERTRSRLMQMDLLAFAPDSIRSPNGICQLLPVGQAKAIIVQPTMTQRKRTKAIKPHIEARW